VCYYTNWSQYRPKHGKFLPEDIDPDLCTHIIFAFGWLKKGKLSSFESNDETKDGKVGLYERIMTLKKANPKLKILLAIGKLKGNFKCFQSFDRVLVYLISGSQPFLDSRNGIDSCSSGQGPVLDS
jgi:GH18 family chitinase